jgi:hypothetical protein
MASLGEDAALIGTVNKLQDVFSKVRGLGA